MTRQKAINILHLDDSHVFVVRCSYIGFSVECWRLIALLPDGICQLMRYQPGANYPTKIKVPLDNLFETRDKAILHVERVCKETLEFIEEERKEEDAS